MRIYSLLALLFAISILLLLKPVPAEAKDRAAIDDDAIFTCENVNPYDLDRTEVQYHTFISRLPRVRLTDAMPFDLSVIRVHETVQDRKHHPSPIVTVNGPKENVVVELVTYEFDQDQNGIVDLVIENYFRRGQLVRQRYQVDEDKDGHFDHIAVYDGMQRACLYPELTIQAWAVRNETEINSPAVRAGNRMADVILTDRENRREILMLVLQQLVGEARGTVPIR